jgi:DNA-binding HxlR family transcriptional regulator
MYQKKLEEDIRCPLEYGLQIFGGKWKSRIICVLNEKKTLRYSQLRKEMANITDAVLAAALKELMADNIISRKSYDEIPPRVEYSLTDVAAPSYPFSRASASGTACSRKRGPNPRTLCSPSARNATTGAMPRRREHNKAPLDFIREALCFCLILPQREHVPGNIPDHRGGKR